MAMAKDPVCGMQVDEQEARQKGLVSEYQGQTYSFCGPGCKREFEQNPQRYAAPQGATR
jgi:YHS domain-containing protein